MLDGGALLASRAPKDVLYAADGLRLGRLVSAHPERLFSAGYRRAQFLTAAIFGALTMLCLPDYPVFSLVTGVPTLMCLYSGLISMWRDARNRESGLYLYEDGLVCTHQGRTDGFRWEELSVRRRTIRRNRKGRMVMRGRIYALSAPGRRTVRVRNAEKTGVWGPHIEDRVRDVQLPGLVEAVRRGEELEFGAHGLSARELRVRGTTVPWKQVERLELKDERLSARVSGRRLALRLGNVERAPNFWMYLDVAWQLRDAGGALEEGWSPERGGERRSGSR